MVIHNRQLERKIRTLLHKAIVHQQKSSKRIQQLLETLPGMLDTKMSERMVREFALEEKGSKITKEDVAFFLDEVRVSKPKGF